LDSSDIYSLDQNTLVELDKFTDVFGPSFCQLEQGRGFNAQARWPAPAGPNRHLPVALQGMM
jgi:hypothetical protein